MNNQDMIKQYTMRYNPNCRNWFTDGGCLNNGSKNAKAAYAIYGEKDNYRKAEMLKGEWNTN